ncbi:hypothetical protein Pmar_PMAR028638 [Perkinsus marinus ATCC 50983]|uniref:Uncharacterized protein n=1 Tax=Perkinsus marinus (strain ATCC 50983 / TXsc) TaxID=423536 RepID=C5K8G6_PERM5|nr:hypothetical protein Pmar_PMAR028638 [Perkinsus marinus ATCC 50983]EER19173.1 hypothetical protein Pmar_PMAR028638 [Perkinsus marinus ATCC 50983]|eukprot:XP_002787377.1 hypothetical protein Pmar_PMAR028638 [Perkinsus marinus ATCC 50983]
MIDAMEHNLSTRPEAVAIGKFLITSPRWGGTPWTIVGAEALAAGGLGRGWAEGQGGDIIAPAGDEITNDALWAGIRKCVDVPARVLPDVDAIDAGYSFALSFLCGFDYYDAGANWAPDPAHPLLGTLGPRTTYDFPRLNVSYSVLPSTSPVESAIVAAASALTSMRMDTISVEDNVSLLRLIMGGVILPGLMLCSSMGAMQLRFGEYSSSALVRCIPDQVDDRAAMVNAFSEVIRHNDYMGLSISHVDG